jgi:lipopolysaccharide export system permease protein
MMRSTLQKYIARQFLFQTLGVIIALTALVEALDLLDNATDILEREPSLKGFGIYLALRLPSILDQVIALGVLLGSVLTFRSLAARNEITVLRSTGITIYSVAYMLLPLVAMIALAQFILKDQVVPRTERALGVWWQSFEPEGEDVKPVWFRAPPYIVSATRLAPDATSMSGVVLYKRNGTQLGERIIAERAEFKDGEWLLHSARVTTVTSDVAEKDPVTELVWPIQLTPDNLLQLSVRDATLSTSSARAVLSGDQPGSRTHDYYATRLYQTYALPFACFVMLLLGMPSAFAQSRDGSAGRRPLLGIAMGLLFLLANGIIASFGQAGVLPPMLAAWAVFFLFGMLAITWLLYLEDA